ncbi:Uncharacterized protein conserved in bacteria [Yersinia pseudotuberculosis]|uniref:DUF2213 domain-containing protein n=1 Tax=Yersinia pseudotuberculosis TaxID=633 RepID=UPI0005DB15CB|nr:DUF2213 domain-containing protein [Yersinia pseudotuberculosis]BCU91106.1 hypothetical protein YP72344_26010 [Yersinia pseudotuberculosis]BET63251.1 hypothetical protein YPSE1_27100 [Yersinia pseudotuberculosis]BET64421.1 hypothetical protein YPSE1_38800 [Yersinia pseudotuberculosis]CNK58654.1 Uncharacterized protein conserved in bacteria [Yersinia pseudotuberculosis]
MPRQIDGNGWFESPDNPILIAGVFEYLGKNLPNAPDPSKIYRVWRPEEELADPECIESFKLLPWIDDHPPGLLGDQEEGFTPSEEKGVHGTIGERVYYKNGVLRGNIKLFSSSMSTLVDEGKKELSPGYRAQYEWSPGVAPSGVAKGQPYDVIQRKPRGNHLASVDEGRQGPSVAVLDAFTIDSKDFIEMTEEEKKALAALLAMLPALQKIVDAAGTTDNEEETKDSEEEEGTKDSEEPEEGTKDSEEEGTADEEDKDKDKEGTADEDDKDKETAAALDAMDKEIKALKRDSFKNVMREVSRRDALARDLSRHVGTFDHADMTTNEVAAYGVKKLKITHAKGQELSCLSGYLQAAKAAPVTTYSGTGLDAIDSGSAISKYLTGDEK